MPIIALTSGIYSNAGSIANKLSTHIGFQLLTDNDIFQETDRVYGIKPSVLKKVIDNKPLVFNDLTHTREKCIASLKKIISTYVSQGSWIFHGLLFHLIPSETTHVIKVLIITDKDSRKQIGIKEHGLAEKDVLKNISNSDKSVFLWTNSLFGKKAWDKSLYDIVVPTDKLSIDNAFDLIIEHFNQLADISEEAIEKEKYDFSLAADVDLVLSKIGQGLTTSVEDGNVVVTINKRVLMLTKLQHKISSLVQAIDGVKSIKTKIGQNYHTANIIHNMEFETPTRILLVDDEKDFVQTLSERLTMRQVQNSVVYSGEDALGFADRKETDVMVLDLKMPGIDGYEVLKQIKKSSPEIEVIILTGHGSEEDRKTCLELGAFAYLQKPADIDILTATMQEAYEKIRADKAALTE